MDGSFAAGFGGSWMLLRWVMMLALACSGLALAACAEMGEAMAASAAEQAAAIAATQAAIATTQAIDQLETASTQISQQIASGVAQPFNFPNMGPVNKGTVVSDTPGAFIVQVNGKRIIFLKPPPPADDDESH
jgi:hypothetical protein